MRLKLILPFLTLALALLMSGCNILSWTGGESAASKIDEGKEHMRNAEYDEALALFAEALEEEPDNADARYYHAKAAVHASGFNSLALAEIMADSDFGPDSRFPFTGTDWPKGRANELYQVTDVIYDDLRPIFFHQTRGSFDSSDIDLDLGLAAGMKGLLMFQDTNMDGVINDDDFDWLIEYLDGLSRGFEISNLPDYINQYSGGNPGKTAGGAALAPSPIDPAIVAAINTFIDNIVEIIDFASAIIISIAEQEFGIDPSDVAEVLEEAKSAAQFYRIGDGVDNDGDGSVDEEVINGLDDDGDGRSDEDSNGTWELL